ncbi:hypothetical protein NESM_000759700 [Novymonas esmeraldas]|uniref:Uncharacterized protein n=1 Tax=Novymonas esmeraldas TaxID=1808958 RepID=A0AAW0EY34_9TRYP
MSSRHTHARSGRGDGDDDCRSTAAALRLLRDAMLQQEWFPERPPLALAAAHPHTRLWCEMWRTEYVCSADAPTGDSDAPLSSVCVGRRPVRHVSAAACDTAAAQAARGRSLVPAVAAYAAPAAAAETERAPAVGTVSAIVRGLPVVDPTAPLYSRDAYMEMVTRLPIGMRLGHTLLFTLALPHDGSVAGRRRGARLVRCVVSHVPASVTLTAAHRVAAAVHPAEAEAAVGDADGAAAVGGAATPPHSNNSNSGGEADDDDDDWEATALEEEARLDERAHTPADTHDDRSAATPLRGTRRHVATGAPRQAPLPPPQPLSRTAACAVDGVAAALPPPCGWWLRRGAPPLPLYAHAVDATPHWLGWLEAAARGCLCGVSLCGWLPRFISPTAVSRAELATRSAAAAVGLDGAVSATLPLRGLHLETTAAALTRLCRVGGALAGSLVALDTPHMRDADGDARGDCSGSSGGGGGECESLAAALSRLHELRMLRLDHGRNVLAEDAAPTRPPPAWTLGPQLSEVRLHGVTGLCATTLASLGRSGTALRTLDLTSTAITDKELRALVYGTDAEGSAAAVLLLPSPLVRLEVLQLTACKHISRVDALVALPRLRRLDVQTSGVCRVADLVGCDRLEELVLTRCAQVTELHPLWRLPQLRCVEAAGVRRLQPHHALTPPPPLLSSSTGADAVAVRAASDAAAFVAPLARLDLTQAATISGVAVSHLARALKDVHGLACALVVLVLDHTEVGDATLRALAGVTTAADEPHAVSAACAPTAASLQELSLVGCAAVHHLGPLGLLPQLTRLVADGSGVEHVGGLERSCTLCALSLSHCTRLWSITELAFASALRRLDVSRTPLGDAGLLRFVFPTAAEELAAWQHHRHTDAAAAAAPWAPPVPSRVEELRLYQCMSLLHIGCVAHLPRLRRLDVSSTAVFDRSFVGLLASAAVLLRTDAVLNAQPAGAEAGDVVVLPDEAVLLAAWRDSDSGDAAARGPPRAVELDFSGGAVHTLQRVSLHYCAEVRCITAFAVFSRLATLELTGTAVDSAALLSFVNVLLESCAVAGAEGPAMRLEHEGAWLCPRPTHTPSHRRPFTLTTLTLAWCHYVSDVRCCAALPSLRHLDVSGTPINNASVAVFSPASVTAAPPDTADALWWRRRRRCCSLRLLDLSHCRGVTDVSDLFRSPTSPRPHGPHALQELRLRRSGVSASPEELRALDPAGHCVFVF